MWFVICKYTSEILISQKKWLYYRRLKRLREAKTMRKWFSGLLQWKKNEETISRKRKSFHESVGNLLKSMGGARIQERYSRKRQSFSGKYGRFSGKCGRYSGKKRRVGVRARGRSVKTKECAAMGETEIGKRGKFCLVRARMRTRIYQEFCAFYCHCCHTMI